MFSTEKKEGSFLILSLPKSQALSHWLFLNWTFFIAALREWKSIGEEKSLVSKWILLGNQNKPVDKDRQKHRFL